MQKSPRPQLDRNGLLQSRPADRLWYGGGFHSGEEGYPRSSGPPVPERCGAVQSDG
nr:MAG TPA: hypothetical protein [Caudoviricetes sp.]